MRICFITVLVLIVSCTPKDHKSQHFDFRDYSDHEFDWLGITSKDHLSAASKRALQWPDIGNELFKYAQL